MNLLYLTQIGKSEVLKTGMNLDFTLKTKPMNAGEFGYYIDIPNKRVSINSYWAKDLPSETVLKVLEEEISHALNCTNCEKRFSCSENYHCEKIKGEGVI